MDLNQKYITLEELRYDKTKYTLKPVKGKESLWSSSDEMLKKLIFTMTNMNFWK